MYVGKLWKQFSGLSNGEGNNGVTLFLLNIFSIFSFLSVSVCVFVNHISFRLFPFFSYLEEFIILRMLQFMGNAYANCILTFFYDFIIHIDYLGDSAYNLYVYIRSIIMHLMTSSW